MKTTTIILAHGDALETIDRHFPIWKQNTDKLVFVSPNDNPCVIDGFDCFTYEGRQHHGQLALKRQMFSFNIALMYESDYYVFMEYDAIMLKRPEPYSVFQGNIFNQRVITQKQKEWLDKGACFIHFPWIFPKDVLKEFVEKATIDPNDNVAHDIWLARKCVELDIKVHNMLAFCDGTGEGFSQNTFDTPERIDAAVKAVKNGAYALHGIKTKEVLDKILQAHDDYKILKESNLIDNNLANKSNKPGDVFYSVDQHIKDLEFKMRRMESKFKKLNDINKTNKVYTYYEDINFSHQEKLIDLWIESWENQGFEAIVLTKSDAEKSPFYKEFIERLSILHHRISGKPLGRYGLSCWLRWLAYSTQREEKFYVCDYDVINHNFKYIEPNNDLILLDGNCPCIASGTPSQFKDLCHKFVDIAEKNIELFREKYKTNNFVHYHDQEFVHICYEINNREIKTKRERGDFLGTPCDEEFWKKQLVHYAHSLCDKYCEKNEVAFDEKTRCEIIEKHLK
jgi:hypothetical protein